MRGQPTDGTPPGTTTPTTSGSATHSDGASTSWGTGGATGGMNTGRPSTSTTWDSESGGTWETGVYTSTTEGSGSWGGSWGVTGGEDPCWWVEEPGPCFEAGCRWDFPEELCVPFPDSMDPPPLCQPEPQDESCGACAAEQCCAQLVSCSDDPLCGCMFNCLMFGNTLFDCQAVCDPSPSGAFLSMCAAGACGPMVCG